ncbi:MAG: hypothetical protein P8R42_12000 [Candidatus Binatia bacterium]|nr:hypothetical protein [Candidatus Binatia bacterium]
MTATLASALAAVFGGILLVRRADARSASPAGAADPAPADPTTPLGRLKGVIQSGDWGAALPSLLALGGILGVMLFGALALIFALDQARSGWPMLILAILTAGWALREYLRA